jgi:putative FmdB family regulatory protein
MPIYEYECRRCSHRFELIQKFSDKPRKRCPECSGAVDRLISPPAIRFKGTGWYVTDYADKGNGKSAEAARPSDTTESDGEANTKKPAAKAEKKAS